MLDSGDKGSYVASQAKRLKRSLTLLPLFGLIYFTVCGGSFGYEQLISSSGPGLALLMLIATPIIFSIPNILMVRELQSMMPVEGGYYHWVKQAFGPLPGFLAGWMNWIVSWVDTSIYPLLFASYLSFFIPQLSNGWQIGSTFLSGPLLSWLVAILVILLMSWLQVRGARLAGLTSSWIGVLILLPLAAMSVLGIYNWIAGGTTASLPFFSEGQDWTGAFSVGLFIVMWNFMGWELPTVAGDEIIKPKKTYSKAMVLVLVATILTYALPTVAGLYGGAGADQKYLLWTEDVSSVEVSAPAAESIPADQLPEGAITTIVAEPELSEPGSETTSAEPEAGAMEAYAAQYGITIDQLNEWGVDPQATNGWMFPDIARVIGEQIAGRDSPLALFLGYSVTVAAMLAMLGLFIGNSLGGSRIPFALAEDGMMPKWMVKVHPRYGTPWVAIAVVGVIYAIFSLQAFSFLVVLDVLLNTLVILMCFAALWKLRFSRPNLPRTKIPGGYFGLVVFTLMPTAIIGLAIYSQVVEEGILGAVGYAIAAILIGALIFFFMRKFIKPGVPDVDPYRTSDE
ncbi:MAG: APC family permease [bacterium]